MSILGESALQLRNKSVTSQLWQKMAHTAGTSLKVLSDNHYTTPWSGGQNTTIAKMFHGHAQASFIAP